MRVDLRDASAPGISAPIAGAGTAVCIGLLELGVATRTASAAPQDVQRAALLALAVYGALGVAVGLACWAARRVHLAPAAAVALLAGMAALPSQPRALASLPAVALGLTVLRVLTPLFDRFRSLPRARIAASSAFVALAAVCALAARALPAYGPRWALGAAVASAGGAVLVWTPRVRGSALLLAAGAVALLAQGAEHVQRLAPRMKPAASAPSVLLVTIDALRADRGAAFGDAAARMPNLDALARDGVRFERAFSHAPEVLGSHASILSGRSPRAVVAAAPVASLASALESAGYVTAAFPSTPRTRPLSVGFQLADGELRPGEALRALETRLVALRLAARRSGPARATHARSAHDTTERATRFLAAHAGAPVFVWVEYATAALPWEPPSDLRPSQGTRASGVTGDWAALSPQERAELVKDPAKRAAMRALYRAELESVDRELGRVVAALRDSAPAGGVTIAVTSPHGIRLGEGGVYWTSDLGDPSLHVPLVMVPPVRAASVPRSVDAVVRLADVAPTLLDWIGLPALAGADGISLRSLAAGQAGAAPPSLAVAVDVPPAGAFRARAAAVRTPEWKLIRREPGWSAPDRWSAGGFFLFDLATDPGEIADRAGEVPDVVRELAAALPEGWERPAAPDPDGARPASPPDAARGPGTRPATRTPDEPGASPVPRFPGDARHPGGEPASPPPPPAATPSDLLVPN